MRIPRRGRDQHQAESSARSAASSVVPDAATEAAGAAARRGAGKALAWILLASGPVLAVLIGFARPAAPAPTNTDRTAATTAGPGGWAELYVRSWLRASRDDDADLTSFYPPGMGTDRQAGTQIPVDTTTLSVRPTGPGTWSVVIAAAVLVLHSDGSRVPRMDCLQVTVLEPAPRDPAPASTPPTAPSPAAGYVAAALPSPVSCPATLSAAAADYPGSAEVDSALGQSILGFLTGYLTGRGGLDRYTSPGAVVTPVTPAPFAAVRISELRIQDQFDRGQVARPLEGARTRVLVRAAGLDVFGQSTPIDYALTVTARAGRWEVTGIDPAPAIAGPPTPPSTTLPPLTPSTPPAAGRPPVTATSPAVTPPAPSVR